MITMRDYNILLEKKNTNILSYSVLRGPFVVVAISAVWGQVDRKMCFRFTRRILYVGFRRQVAKKYDCDRIVILHYSGCASYRTHVAHGYRVIQ